MRKDGGGLPDELLLTRVREAMGSWVAREGQEVVVVSSSSREESQIEGVTELMVTCVAVVNWSLICDILLEG